MDNYWGYSDGDKIFIGSYGHHLCRIGNTFDFYQDHPSIVSKRVYNPVLGGSTVESIFLFNRFPYQIDIETGEIY